MRHSHLNDSYSKTGWHMLHMSDTIKYFLQQNKSKHILCYNQTHCMSVLQIRLIITPKKNRWKQYLIGCPLESVIKLCIYVATFQQHQHMEYISLSWYDIPELVVLFIISVVEDCCYQGSYQWFLEDKLKSSLRKFYGRHHDLFIRYGISVTKIPPSVYNLQIRKCLLSLLFCYCLRLGIKRRTITIYHTIEINDTLITDSTVVLLDPLPSKYICNVGTSTYSEPGVPSSKVEVISL